MITTKNWWKVTVIILLTFFHGPVSAQSNNLNDYAKTSDFLSDVLKKNSNGRREMKGWFKREPENFKIWASVHRSCPTNWWWSAESGRQEELQRKLRSAIKRALKGFPPKTIQECMEIAPVFSDMQPKKHWRNKNNFYTNPSALAIKNPETGRTSVFRSLVSSNNSGGKKEAFIYNENRDLVCKISKISLKTKTAKADCKGLGRGNVIARLKGRTVTFSITTPKAVIFAAVGVNIAKAKRNYPDIFK